MDSSTFEIMITQNTTDIKSPETPIIEQLADFIGVIAALGAIYYFFKIIGKKTSTDIISDDARRVLENQSEAKRLREAIDTYHITGDWEKTKINEIL